MVLFFVKKKGSVKTKEQKKRKRVSHCHHHSPRVVLGVVDSDSGEAKAQKNWSEMVSNLNIRTESVLQG